ncbi:hypothetical protein GCM10009619_42500 [Williamsia maris]|uniref:Uncharacterized protein n=1 Tax=Williamsia maris TaxID=72806 RepID=A0ABT1HJN5_9NOCA|nr:hypothetical protein [Williamsia maris]
MAKRNNEATFRFELPSDLEGAALSDQIKRATVRHAGDAGAVAIGDVLLTGSLDLGTGMRQHTVRVHLYFGGGSF